MLRMEIRRYLILVPYQGRCTVPIEIEDRLTPVTPQFFVEVLYRAWVELLEEVPSKEALLVLTAKSALETGRWKYMHNYNIGNAKSVEGDGRNYTYFACNEILTLASAKAFEAKNPETAKITRIIPAKVSGGSDYAEIWFYPKHPGCRFRAYRQEVEDGAVDETASFLLGMLDYLRLLRSTYLSSWDFVKNGDPEGFVRALKAKGYFTAPLDSYLQGVVSLFKEFSKLPLDFSGLSTLSERQRAEVQKNTLSMMQDDLLRSKIGK